MNFLNKFKKEKTEKFSVMKKKQINKSYYDEIVKIENVEGMYQTLNKLANPDEVLKKTGKGIACLRNIENAGDVATCVDSRKAGVQSLSWRLKYNDDEKYKEFYDNLFDKIDVHTLISDILNAPLYGYQPIEVAWKLDEEGYVVPKKITAMPQEWFFFNSERQLCFRQKGYPNGRVILEDEKKMLCPKHKPSFMNPYGISILSRCFWDVAFIKGGIEFWVRFMEKYGMPFLIGKHPEKASEDEKTDLLNMLVQMVQDAVSVIPEDSSLEIKEAAEKSASADIYEKFISLCQKNIHKNILGQTLTTDVGTVGSLAAGKVHADVRDDIVQSDVKLVIDTINKLLKWIHELNFSDGLAPKIEIYEEEDSIKKDVAERDEILAKQGVKFTKNYYIKTYGFDEEDILISESEKKTEDFSDFEKIDDLTTNLTNTDLSNILDKDIKKIVEEFSQVPDQDKALEQLAEIYPDLEFPELEETLTKSIFVADLLGRISND
ncbi:MAG: DUF935 family protein [Candidatus Gastranaerophilales bacterium]|nr:DUF935 family protein [Candidatus Gastranaerophilales bacterium]